MVYLRNDLQLSVVDNELFEAEIDEIDLTGSVSVVIYAVNSAEQVVCFHPTDLGIDDCILCDLFTEDEPFTAPLFPTFLLGDLIEAIATISRGDVLHALYEKSRGGSK